MMLIALANIYFLAITQAQYDIHAKHVELFAKANKKICLLRKLDSVKQVKRHSTSKQIVLWPPTRRRRKLKLSYFVT